MTNIDDYDILADFQSVSSEGIVHGISHSLSLQEGDNVTCYDRDGLTCDGVIIDVHLLSFAVSVRLDRSTMKHVSGDMDND